MRNCASHAFLLGACVMGLADGVAQMMGELPVGVITALVGGIFFCRVLMRR
ncbi:MAG: iron chelate uptake ABC transporter family permease subunit [Synergistaceae bacterium]|nr:iron chelate uptake ABC transporter family permease subunit [Synergistaceae bacterium]